MMTLRSLFILLVVEELFYKQEELLQQHKRTESIQHPKQKGGALKLVPQRRFELPTSPLPRECSTPELLRHFKMKASVFIFLR